MNYYIGPDGELYHGLFKKREPKEDHKYIKREWKNGKWIYTYPDDKKGKKSQSTKNAKPSLSSKRDISGARTKPKIGKLVDRAKLSIGNRTKSNTRENLEVSTQLKKTPNSMGKASSEYENELDYNSKRNVYPAHSSSETKSKKKDETLLDKAKNWIKDKLGYDEKEAAETAAATKQEAEKKAAVAQSTYDLVRDMAYSDNKLTDNEKQRIRNAKLDAILADQGAKDAGRKYANAQSEWLDSPLYKFNAFIDSLKNPKSTQEKFEDYIKRLNDEVAEEKAAEEAERARSNKELEYDEKERSIIKRMKEIAEKYGAEYIESIKKIVRNNPLPGLDLKDEATTPADDMEMTNPNYNKDELDLYDENCGLCTLAYDLRRRGYDVVANNELSTKDGEAGMYPEDQLACYDGGLERMDDWWEEYSRTKKAYESGTFREAVDEIERTMLEYGDGARGTLNVYWIQGGGHSIAWEVENGKVVIRDAQTGEEKNMGYYANYCDRMAHVRLDDLEPNEEILRYVSERKREGEH